MKESIDLFLCIAIVIALHSCKKESPDLITTKTGVLLPKENISKAGDAVEKAKRIKGNDLQIDNKGVFMNTVKCLENISAFDDIQLDCWPDSSFVNDSTYETGSNLPAVSFHTNKMIQIDAQIFFIPDSNEYSYETWPVVCESIQRLTTILPIETHPVFYAFIPPIGFVLVLNRI